MNPRLLILETSGRIGLVGLAEGSRLVASRRLDEARRHARDLAPAVADLLKEQKWKPGDVQAVIVSRGPGSYTGLRVGIMSAKTFAYATGCAFLAADTFAVIAANSPAPVQSLEVIADAQQGRVYVQRYGCKDESQDWHARTPLTILALDEWMAHRHDSDWVTGPGLETYGSKLPAEYNVVDPAFWHPALERLLQIGLARLERQERDNLLTAEPLYLRGSAAEEKWQSLRARNESQA
ncbi:MAG: tRNA (adenosine(37)-N6)-threonylcarbamoyltransferase complex dimerization subunit type 1 TsaB [Gemmataceae bacterium]